MKPRSCVFINCFIHRLTTDTELNVKGPGEIRNKGLFRSQRWIIICIYTEVIYLSLSPPEHLDKEKAENVQEIVTAAVLQ